MKLINQPEMLISANESQTCTSGFVGVNSCSKTIDSYEIYELELK